MNDQFEMVKFLFLFWVKVFSFTVYIPCRTFVLQKMFYNVKNKCKFTPKEVASKLPSLLE